MFIGIAATIPDLPNLPGQGGEDITVTLDYPSSNVCYDGTTSPSDASPAGGTFSYTGSGTLDLNTSTGAVNAAGSDPGSYTVIYTKSGVSSNFPIVIGNDITLSITPVPGATICTGDTATLTANASGGSGGFTYSWNTTPAQTTQAISVTTTGTYTVTVTDSNGCTAQASQLVTASTAGTTIANIDNDYAMSFNGVDQYIASGVGLGNTLGNGLADMTISMWVNITPGSSNDGIFKIGALASNVGKFAIRVATDARIQAYFAAGTVSKQYDLLAAGNWNHIAIVKEGTTVSGYVNGVLTTPASSSGSIPSTLDFSNEPAFIGLYWDLNPIYLFNGKIDEVAVWNSALSSCDVKGIFEATTTVAGQPKSANLLDANTTIPAPVYWNRMGDS